MLACSIYIVHKDHFSVGIIEHPIYALQLNHVRQPDRYHYLMLLGMEPLEEQSVETVSSSFDNVTSEKTRTETPNCIDCNHEN